MIKERHRYLQGIDIRQREVGGWRDNEEFKIKNKRRQKPPLIFLSYAAISVYRANIQCALMAATSPPQKCAVMALGVRSR